MESIRWIFPLIFLPGNLHGLLILDMTSNKEFWLPFCQMFFNVSEMLAEKNEHFAERKLT